MPANLKKFLVFVAGCAAAFVFVFVNTQNVYAYKEIFTTAGSSTWAVPTGVTSIIFKSWGAGGGGGRGVISGSTGAGGAGAGFAGATIFVTSTESLIICVMLAVAAAALRLRQETAAERLCSSALFFRAINFARNFSAAVGWKKRDNLHLLSADMLH